jgi:hypothetical protein
MNLEKPTRKKRIDRTHIIYELRVNGASYIGVTAKTETTINKSVLGTCRQALLSCQAGEQGLAALQGPAWSQRQERD